MLKIFQVSKYYLLLFGLMSLPLAASGQDLGSSSGLFNNPKTRTTSKTPPKKTAPPSKRTIAAKKKTILKTARNYSRRIVVNEPPIAVNRTPPAQTNLVITVGGKATGDFDEFFERAIEEGAAARVARHYAKAEDAYLRARSLKTKDSRAVYGLGNLYSDQQRWEEAERAYRTAINIEPNAPEAYVALSFVLTQPIIGGNLASRYTEAEKHARRAIKIDPKNASAYDQLGVALELRGVVSQDTQNAYRKAIELEPKFALAYAHLGRLLRKIGSADESIAAYHSAIEFSTDAPTMILVADVMQSQQKYRESEHLLRRALKKDEGNPTALLLLGRALTTRGSYEEAEKMLGKSAEASPNSFVSYTLLGSLAMRQERFDDAEQYLMKVVNMISPSEKKRLAQEFEAVGDGYAGIGKNKDAVRLFLQAVALDKYKKTLAGKLARARKNQK
jgi:superkiller protein 3